MHLSGAAIGDGAGADEGKSGGSPGHCAFVVSLVLYSVHLVGFILSVAGFFIFVFVCFQGVGFRTPTRWAPFVFPSPLDCRISSSLCSI